MRCERHVLFVFKEFYIMIVNKRFRSIYTFWSSIFEQPIMLDGKIIDPVECAEEADLWDLTDIFDPHKVWGFAPQKGKD